MVRISLHFDVAWQSEEQVRARSKVLWHGQSTLVKAGNVARHVGARPVWARLGEARQGTTRIESWRGEARPGESGLVMARIGVYGRGAEQGKEQGKAGRVGVGLSKSRLGAAWLGLAGHGESKARIKASRGKSGLGLAGRGLARPVWEWLDKTCFGLARIKTRQGESRRSRRGETGLGTAWRGSS